MIIIYLKNLVPRIYGFSFSVDSPVDLPAGVLEVSDFLGGRPFGRAGLDLLVVTL